MPSEGERVYGTWAPAGGIWSAWAKPVLFTCLRPGAHALPPLPPTGWAPEPHERAAIVVDLPGARAVAAGLALAAGGYRPVPLFNAVHDKGEIIDQEPILSALAAGAASLAAAAIPASAPPAFLLDSRRLAMGSGRAPGKLDNRWMAFPQDFPSANLLLSRGIRRAIVLHEGSAAPQADLAHVLLRWQEGGVRIEAKSAGDPDPPRPIEVRRPFRYRIMWYRALALLGLGRNAAGGFGMRIPVPTQSTGGGFH